MSKFFSKYCLLIIVFIQLICSVNIKWGGYRWKQILEYDGKGYFAYLPAIFIYHDLQFSFAEEIEKKYSSTRTYFNYRMQFENKMVNKYFSGTSLAILPFFITAHILTLVSGGLADGYSFFYQVSVCIAAIFYCFIGLFYLKKILNLYPFTRNTITLVCLSIGLGTHLFYYTVYEPSMSHIYSFAFISMFIFYGRRIFEPDGIKYLPLLGILTGIIILIRPVNALIILILPFIGGSPKAIFDLFTSFSKKISVPILTVILSLFIISLQGWIYYLQCGNFFTYSYGGENFIWNRPEMINILFSYRKGLFIYTPMIFISMAGLYSLYKKNSFAFLSFSFFFLLITYVFSCWCSWSYGGSFSSRPYVEYMSLFGILLAYLLSGTYNKIYRAIIFAMLGFCLILSHIQFYQYRYFIIHWDNMDKEHYWRVFMRVDQLVKEENANKDLLE